MDDATAESALAAFGAKLDAVADRSRVSVLRDAAAGLIGLYQAYLSPMKGYRCAYRVHTGRHSCSQYAKRLVLKRGVSVLPAGLRRQFERCRAALHAIQQSAESAEHEAEERKRKRQEEQKRSDEGECGACDIVDCGSCGGTAADEVGGCGDAD